MLSPTRRFVKLWGNGRRQAPALRRELSSFEVVEVDAPVDSEAAVAVLVDVGPCDEVSSFGVAGDFERAVSFGEAHDVAVVPVLPKNTVWGF